MSSYDTTRRLIDAREEMRALFGAAYPKHAAPYADMVKAEMARTSDTNPINAAITLAKISRENDDSTKAYIAARMALAASLDVIEAHEDTP